MSDELASLASNWVFLVFVAHILKLLSTASGVALWRFSPSTAPPHKRHAASSRLTIALSLDLVFLGLGENVASSDSLLSLSSARVTMVLLHKVLQLLWYTALLSYNVLASITKNPFGSAPSFSSACRSFSKVSYAE